MKILRYSIIPVILFVLSFTSVFITQDDYAPQWDAASYYPESRNFGTWFRSLITDEEAPPISDINYYFPSVRTHPPVGKILMGITSAVFRKIFGEADSLRVAVMFCYALIIVCIFVVCRLKMGTLPGLFAALMFWSMPRVFCHGHLLALDLFVIPPLFLCIMLFEILKDKKWIWIITGVLLGITLLTKLQGGFIPVIFGVWLLWESILEKINRKPFSFHLWIKVFFAGTLGVLVFFIGWPLLWLDFFGNLKSYTEFLLVRKDLNVFYFGKTLAAWHYPFVMTLITTPIIIILFGVIGIVVTFRKKAEPFQRLFLCGLLVPLAIIALPGVKRYDGIRLFLPFLPFLACISGVGFWEVIKIINQKSWDKLKKKTVTISLLVISTFLAFLGIFFYHPHEILFYNSLVGGFRGAWEKGMDGDYWGLCLNKAWPHLNKALPDGCFLFIGGANTANFFSPVGQPGPGESRDDFIKPTFRVVSLPLTNNILYSSRGTVALINSRRGGLGPEGEYIMANCKPLFKYEFQGIPILRAYKYPDNKYFYGKTLHVFDYIDIYSVSLDKINNSIQIIWRLREHAPVLGLRFVNKETNKVILNSNWICPVYPTVLWYPSDVFRVNYEIPKEIDISSLKLEILNRENDEIIDSVEMDKLIR